MKRITLLCLLLALSFGPLYGQGNEDEMPQVDHSYKPLTLKLSEDGKKFVRFIIWHQMWLETNDLNADELTVTPRVRRSRFLAFAEISPRFMLLTHIGINNLNSSNMNISGVQSNGPQVFLHDAWGNFTVVPGKLDIGMGLHYYNGLSRLASASTLNFMTLDNANPFFAWHSLGYTDQFARHLGVYAKGKIGKLDYRISLNDALLNNFDANTSLTEGIATYNNRLLSLNASDGLDDIGRSVLMGYFQYEFLDAESNKLPYRVGSYLGKKKVFNIGAGFFSHADGTVALNEGATDPTLGGPNTYTRAELEAATTTYNVFHYAIDAFYDAPVGSKGAAINAYLTYQDFDYGDNFNGRWMGSGSLVYAQFGYLTPKFSEKGRLMPYVTYNNKSVDVFSENESQFGIGANWFINGHNAKLTVEYNTLTSRSFDPDQASVDRLTLQAMFFL